MKKQSYLIIALLFMTSIAFTAQAQIAKGDVKGSWRVADIQLEGFPEGYQIKNAFGWAPYETFIGSTWKLHGSYKGSITLSNGESTAIYWDLLKDSSNPIFQFKTIPQGVKARDVKEGYRLDIQQQDKQTLSLRSPIAIDNGSTAYIVYNLERQQ